MKHFFHKNCPKAGCHNWSYVLRAKVLKNNYCWLERLEWPERPRRLGKHERLERFRKLKIILNIIEGMEG